MAYKSTTLPHSGRAARHNNGKTLLSLAVGNSCIVVFNIEIMTWCEIPFVRRPILILSTVSCLLFPNY